jgi:alkanesulfonate monooxygenase SsuD/methylene tetrahydromethanopterin reductase-like flavin-dependent oxidoreductase (luciferase family)
MASGEKSGYVALLRFVYVAETVQEAKVQTRDAVSRYAEYDCDIHWDWRTDSAEYAGLLQRMNMLIGTPSQVREQLTLWQAEHAFDEIICQTYAAGRRHEHALRSIELLGCEVLPQLQTSPPRRSTIIGWNAGIRQAFMHFREPTATIH